MEIWPAIDLRGGKCVRLRQGDYQQETIYGEPVEMAQKWVSEGATCLHLVDLDGARDGSNANLAAVKSIVEATKVPCQLGGGIRDEHSIERMLAIGVYRLIVGTKAIKDPAWFREMCRKYPHQLAAGIDARNGLVATDGWLETSGVSAIDLARDFQAEPIAAVIYTDIARDGMLQGVNLPAMTDMKRAITTPVIASGGVTTVDDIRQLAAAGLDGTIVGRALYEGTVTLQGCLEAAR
ncbi:phosphoribosylformimino-5-aminoimidazole carboxamide ribotide isomerase [Pirellula staleyi DSM 6068]|uniref:1-(5-phosphoribosyl)-5-[(5-phosphoribosylamino)methylideneamino] imidazole-4-carboxamide isomerase n=1 Tax=Pirellula staleyi (strain ATCC 27377 / DSM 6068 / ICPB 4128) TaxID=530564 RepID=D2R5Y2_PIRSD|nr:1-(5-phosphoribosyl)-5-[(5-phosphoribosylamino)methylideneamino]imidazole-4-carboxamide isomerase [Pirellula staleyi]ADB19067.1 phosphoribosylformimino-5-aminoimidazole carboxamide ribotide isomerase [Pirellula staleyi DSM 6068]